VEIIVSRRENVVRAFFWAILVFVLMMTGYSLIAGKTDRSEVGRQPYKQADLQQQMDQYNSVLKKNPKDLRTLVALGDLYLKMDNEGAAFEVFQRAEKVDPDNAHVLSDIGGIYQQIGQYDSALKRYRKAYDLHPQNNGLLLKMALIYSRYKEEPTKALDLLEQFLATSPEPQLAATAKQEIVRIRQFSRPVAEPKD